MFEAVGEKYWPVYFDKIKQCLKPGKQATLQIITIQDARWEVYRKSVDFIQKYIFPGGMLPSPSVLRKEVHSRFKCAAFYRVWKKLFPNFTPLV